MPYASQCRADNPLKCRDRATGEAHGHHIWFSYDDKTWYWKHPQGIWAVTHCPFCKSPLPRMVDAILRALAEPDDEC
jgi:hypothetical protein